jgi:uncharacterized protein with PQ loop repeat
MGRDKEPQKEEVPIRNMIIFFFMLHFAMHVYNIHVILLENANIISGRNTFSPYHYNNDNSSIIYTYLLVTGRN